MARVARYRSGRTRPSRTVRLRLEDVLPTQDDGIGLVFEVREAGLDRSPGTGKDHIGYHALTQAALRGVARAALDKACRMNHLPGDHHFFVTFRTHMAGVQMADWLKDKFPEEMTIVIQHQYSGFQVHDDRFEIVLSFGGKPEHLRVPFAALTRFVDPSVNFGVQMEAVDPKSGAPVIVPEKRTASGGGHASAAPAPTESSAAADGTVVSFDKFRRK